ncbi:DUF2610 domain-containing protein [Prosthecobacter fluviatilis]|uniref:DUF2610 domain-containing protein n=1 Tax=Prosthecobacter fluviatilis TaxID=445931 RepID=A0ABW0KVP6_9BACT
MNPTPASSEVTPDSPWLGLRSYGEGDAAHFFGREKELADLRERVLHKPLTILFGQSGWGKTSLLQAGLVPQLRKDGFLPVIIRLVHDEGAGSLEAQVIGALAKALHAAGCTKAAADVSATLAQGGTASLWLLLHDPVFGLTGADGGVPQPVFIFDQFEEMFTLGDKPERRAATLAFRDVLASLVENRPNAAVRQIIAQDEELADRVHYQARSYRVLMALRYDFLHLLERWRKQMPSLMDNRMELRLLAGPQAFEAVVRPGQKRPGQPPIIPDEVGRAIVRFVAGVAPDVPLGEIDAVPPLLSLICSELNSQRQALGLEQISQSQFEGSGAEILNSFYERSFDPATYGAALEAVPLGGATLQALRRLIEDRLLSAEGFRESIAFDTMLWELSGKADADTAKKVLALLVERRLLSVDERGGVQRLELTHDVLTRVARASREARKEKEALEKARLDQEHAEAEKQKALAEKNRLRKFALAAAACAIAAIIAAVFGWVGMQRAREAAAEARRQEAEANTQREQARRQEEVARRQEAEAKRQQAEANAGFDAARDATDKMVAKLAGEDFAFVPGIQPFREESARKAIELYQYLASRRPDDQSIQIGLLRMEAARANILSQIGTVEEAKTAYETLVPRLRKAQSLYSSPDFSVLLANTFIDYDVFIDDNGFPDDESLLKDALKAIEPLATEKHDPRAGLVLVRAYNIVGLHTSVREEKMKYYTRARDWGKEFLSKREPDAALLDRFSAATHNLGRQLQISESLEDQKKGLELMTQADELQKKALALQPDSPRLLSNAAIGLQQRAELQAKLGNFDEAGKLYEQATATYRLTASANPRVTLYRAWLADGLKNHGVFLSRRQDYVKAKQLYSEGISLLEELVKLREDRPLYGQWLLSLLNQLADFEQGGKGTGAAAKNTANPALAHQIRERGIMAGKKFVEKYPQHMGLRDELGLLLSKQANFEPIRDDKAKAAPLLKEAIGVLKQGFAASPKLVTDYYVSNIIQWTVTHDDALIELAKTEKNPAPLVETRIAYLDGALSYVAHCNSTNSKQTLLDLAQRRANLYLDENKPDKAMELQLRMVELCEKSYLEKPYLYYLRQSFANLLRSMARSYQQLGNREAELRLWQRWLKELAIPHYGFKEPELLDPALEPTDENLAKLRSAKDRLPKLKMFIIPCEVNGVMIPVQFYINNAVPEKDADPIADQARWIKEERGVEVPADVRDSLRKLAAIAHENNVGFADLCTYALNYPTDNKDKKDEKPSGTGTKKATQPRMIEPKGDEKPSASVTKKAASPIILKAKKKAGPPAVAGEKAASDLPKLPDSLSFDAEMARLKAARAELAKAPSDALRFELASQLGNSAFEAVFQKRYKDAVAWSREALDLIAACKADHDPKRRADMVFIYGNLAHALLFQGQYEEAIKMYKDHWDAPMLGRIFKDGVAEDFAMLEKAGIGREEMARARKDLGLPAAAAPAPAKGSPQ